VQNWKHFFEPGTVIALPCSDRSAALASLKYECDRLHFRVVSLHWKAVGSIEGLLDEVVEGLARLALAMWPNWYDGLIPTQEPSRPAWRQQLSPQWREIAQHYCSTGQMPLPRGYAAAEQATQLALALGPNELAIAIAVDEATEESSIVLRAAAEWLTSNTAASVVILCPASAAQGIKLQEVPPWGEMLLEPHDSEHRATEDKKPEIDVFPVVGVPHPLSPGEQRLAQCLLADAELAPLFAFNQRITGRHGNAYTVDLVWNNGRLIVEVDSFQVHGNRFAFARDRHRDYELMASDYRVLRITDDEAANDTQSAVAKIRQLVRLLKESAKLKQGVLS
jgi:very-short-patch-repair endonuclease